MEKFSSIYSSFQYSCVHICHQPFEKLQTDSGLLEHAIMIVFLSDSPCFYNCVSFLQFDTMVFSTINFINVCFNGSFSSKLCLLILFCLPSTLLSFYLCYLHSIFSMLFSFEKDFYYKYTFIFFGFSQDRLKFILIFKTGVCCVLCFKRRILEVLTVSICFHFSMHLHNLTLLLSFIFINNIEYISLF